MHLIDAAVDVGCKVLSITDSPVSPVAKPASLVLQVKEAWFRYDRDGADILQGVSFAVEKGTIHAIVGGNGAGKSTLLKSICGINRIYRGKVSVLGKNLKKYAEKGLKSAQIIGVCAKKSAFLPKLFALVPYI